MALQTERHTEGTTTEPRTTRERSYARERGHEPRRTTRHRASDGSRSAFWEDRSVPDLLRELSGEVADLARLEVELAKTEMSEKLDVFQRSMVKMIVGGTFLLAALLILLWAVNLALTALLAQFLAVEVVVWLSPLILAAVLGLVGWSMMKGGTHSMKREGVAPRQTQETLGEDRRWAQHKAREIKQDMKEDLRHG